MGIVCCREDLLDLDGEVELSHFTLLRSVGKGAFGKVRVVQHKGTKQLYALKYINKAKCIQMRAVENIISERKMLEQISCNLIVNMRYAFQDDDNLFMILDLMLGGDLRFHLDRVGILPEDHVRFYAAEIAVSLDYLHRLNIIHRDVKPDNILLDEQGHAHLTDFNIATTIKNQKPITSIAGSFAYIAPEVLLKRGYLASVDWWSMGIVLYELLFGKRPFRGKTNDALQQAILNDPVCFPESHKVSTEGIDFIKCLLTRDIKSRIGYGDQGFQRLMSHPWFIGIPWDKLETKEAEPPFSPDSKRANFDPTHELEEILLEDNPLKVKKRSAKRSTGNASYATSNNSKSTDIHIPEQSPERQLMEDKFLVYDYTKPDENESRRKLIEQRYWAQRMNKTTGEKHGLQANNAPYGSTRNAGATYKSSVLDYLNQKPSTPLSAGDILKLEELARTARNTNGKGNDWRPPSGLMGNSTPDGAPLDAVQARDEYILRNGGVPPPSRPPPLHQTYNHSNYPNTTTTTTTEPHHQHHQHHQHHHKPSQEYSPTSYQTRRSSDDSYRIASSPDNSEYPLMGSVAALSEDYNIQQINNHLDDRNHTSKPLNKNNNNNHNNNISKMYSVSTISTNSSNTLHDNTSRSNTTSNTTTTTTTTSTLNNVTSRPSPARVSSIPRIHSNPLPPPSCLPPPIPSELPPLPPLPRNYI
ncbi:kinase-like domain-containing protein [Pilaira anomala]|nr:kinase-like domain-containing protein [Pilaira anomala]